MYNSRVQKVYDTLRKICDTKLRRQKIRVPNLRCFERFFLESSIRSHLFETFDIFIIFRISSAVE